MIDTLVDALIARRDELTEEHRAAMIAAAKERQRAAEAAGVTDPDILELQALWGARDAAPLRSASRAMARHYAAERLERVQQAESAA